MTLVFALSSPVTISVMSADTCLALCSVVPLFLIALIADRVTVRHSGQTRGARVLARIRLIRWLLLPLLFGILEISFALGIGSNGYSGGYAYFLWVLFFVMIGATLGGWFVTLWEALRSNPNKPRSPHQPSVRLRTSRRANTSRASLHRLVRRDE